MGLSYNPPASERVLRRMARIVKIDQERFALDTERRRLVRENEEDEWLACGHQWRGKVVSLDQFRNNLRFRPRHQPTTHVA